MTTTDPALSVVMAVYNGARYLREALESILNQTFSSFECLVIDDASTDETPTILTAFAKRDTRVRVITNEKNQQLARSLNRGIALARGRYVVRMDADDICLPDRFQKQWAFMQAHPDVAVSCGKFFTLRGTRLIPCGLGRRCEADSVRAMLLFFDPILHPGVIAKTEVMRRYPYDPARTCTEDLDLWCRMARDGLRLACQNEYLMLYRLHETSVCATRHKQQSAETAQIEAAFYRELLQPLDEETLAFYLRSVYFPTHYDGPALYRFYRSLCAANRRTRQFRTSRITYALLEVLAEYRRSGALRVRDQLALWRFGGGRFVTEWLRKKRRARRDLSRAVQAAQTCDFIKIQNGAVFPLFSLTEDFYG